MNVPRARFVLATGSILMLIAPLIAHHSILPFDLTRPVEIRGEVLSLHWQNPHVRIDVSVKKEGDPAVWSIEADSPLGLENLGWSKSSLSAGQKVSVYGAPARDGSPSILCETVTPEGGAKLACLPQARR